MPRENVTRRSIPLFEPPTLESVVDESPPQPTRMVLHAIPGWGKTSFAAQAPSPIFLMTRGEDGLKTLMRFGQLPKTAHFPNPVETFDALERGVMELIVKEHPYRSFVLDTINGAERLAQEDVCDKQCDGDWSKFDAFGRGVKLTLPLMIRLTEMLDRLRAKGMTIILLSHSAVKPFRNPTGADYDRWEPVLTKETWGHLDRWEDLCLFGQFHTVVQDQKTGKAKGKGGELRTLHTERTAAYDAKNRIGLTDEIDCGSCASEAWANLIKAIQVSKK